MSSVSAQVSLYPLGEPSLAPFVEEALQLLQARGLEVYPGTMSTVVTGEDEEVFDALREIYRENADRGPVVMSVTFSNACPTTAAAGGG